MVSHFMWLSCIVPYSFLLHTDTTEHTRDLPGTLVHRESLVKQTREGADHRLFPPDGDTVSSPSTKLNPAVRVAFPPADI